MYKVGDKISLGRFVGEIVNVDSKTWIGFHPHNETHYDIILKRVPEEAIKCTPNGTDTRNSELSV